MRDMSRVEFERKLAAKEFSAEDIAEAVVWCEAEGWLNETRYAEGTARRLGYRYGASRITQTLKQKGVPDAVVATAVGEMKDTEVARAREVLMRKFGESFAGQPQGETHGAPIDHDTRVKQIRYMQTRGFSYDTIKRAMRPAEDD